MTALSALCALVATLAWAAAPAQAASQTFFATGGEQTFTVPTGVTSIHVIAVGATGGAATDSVGGVGAEVIGDVSVIPGQTLYIEVGGKGKDLTDGGAGGFNGGAAGAGGGGGASDVRTSPREAVLSLESRLIAAAGGGGGGGSGPSGAGADGGAAGGPGEASEAYSGGGAGTQTEGGLGAGGCLGEGGNGQLGLGGTGGDSGAISAPGGGGGGGYYGGGGGGGACEVGSSGGGGGSSLKPAGGSVELASPSTVPQVQIIYTPASSPIATVPPVNTAGYPDTILGAHPKEVIRSKKKKVTVKFSFSSTVAGATFQCKLDKAAFAPCTSPKSYKVKRGKHTFSVAAVSAGGIDPAPATFTFKVKKKH